ncbi:AraC family transcriptional regulator [Paractinoplanes hotanensis]|uniref:AraC family transcriptional regulator n=1 Tax=Paractinoplanes hotanensis TaxID=2906497 RepID=A0ABT0XZW7_9ACTN|nr:AraC family transcriptional regulator [Actinoplanes hotanensis]MCM4079329.1 AraC family transcriptional regulator [Actinoplanes hotanensis]
MSLDELRTLLDRHARSGVTTAIDGVLIGRATRAHESSVSMSGTVLALIAQGAKTLVLGDRVYEYRAGQYLVASVDLPVSGHYTEAPALGFGLVLDPAEIAELLLAAPPGSLPQPDGPTSAIAVSDAPDELIGAAVRMLRLLETPRDIPVVAPLIRREILWRLVTGEQGAAVRQLGLAGSSVTQVAQAVRWIRDHYRESFRIDDLARRSGLSVSAFHRHFQAVTAMSPIQFQKRIRLQEARLMLAAQPNDVTGISHRVGYDSPSQFSREYRRQFGEPPSRDAARLRDGSPAPAMSVL